MSPGTAGGGVSSANGSAAGEVMTAGGGSSSGPDRNLSAELSGYDSGGERM